MKTDLVALEKFALAGVLKKLDQLFRAQQVREYVYAYAPVAPQLGQITSLVLPYANTKMMNLFLKQVSEDFRDYFIIMEVDRAPWHRSKTLEIPENIRLLTQASYSPELMPVEHLWEDLRENYFNNRIFNSMSKVVDELCQGLVNLQHFRML